MPRPYPKEFEQQVKELREIGYSFQEIANLMKVPVSTAIFWAHGVKPLNGGRSPEWLRLSDLIDYLKPGVPFKELPLPSGLIAWLKKQANDREGKKREKQKEPDVSGGKSNHSGLRTKSQ